MCLRWACDHVVVVSVCIHKIVMAKCMNRACMVRSTGLLVNIQVSHLMTLNVLIVQMETTDTSRDSSGSESSVIIHVICHHSCHQSSFMSSVIIHVISHHSCLLTFLVLKKVQYSCLLHPVKYAARIFSNMSASQGVHCLTCLLFVTERGLSNSRGASCRRSSSNCDILPRS